MLTVNDVFTSYGMIKALNGVTLNGKPWYDHKQSRNLRSHFIF